MTHHPFEPASPKALGCGAQRHPPWSDQSLGGRDKDPTLGQGLILYDAEHNTKTWPRLTRSRHIAGKTYMLIRIDLVIANYNKQIHPELANVHHNQQTRQLNMIVGVIQYTKPQITK